MKMKKHYTSLGLLTPPTHSLVQSPKQKLSFHGWLPYDIKDDITANWSQCGRAIVVWKKIGATGWREVSFISCSWFSPLCRRRNFSNSEEIPNFLDSPLISVCVCARELENLSFFTQILNVYFNPPNSNWCHNTKVHLNRPQWLNKQIYTDLCGHFFLSKSYVFETRQFTLR